MESHYSDHIFEIANKYSLPMAVDQLWPISDEAFEGFKAEYNSWSPNRNTALEHHLDKRPNLFRVFLPYTQRVFALASSVVWYLDEIIVRDPVSVVLNNPTLDIQEAKIQLKQVLQVLSLFRPAIEDGYILLRGSEEASTKLKEPSEIAINLSKDGELVNAIVNSANYGHLQRTGEHGETIHIYKASLDSGGIVQYKIEGIPGGKTVTIPINMNEEYPQISLIELTALLGHGPEEQLTDIIPREIERVIRATEAAQSMNSAVLFDRDVDSMILNKANMSLSEDHQLATAGLFDLTLPFVKGIPADRLMDLRSKMPDAFMDFRSNMLEIVKNSMSESDDIANIREAINSHVIPNLRELNGEIGSTLKRTKIMGLGIPIVTGVAVLAGGIMSAPAWPLVGAAAGGVIGGVKAASDSASALEKTKSHPFYFLWKARNDG